MKVAELEKQKDIISKRIKESDLIDKCINIARCGKNTFRDVRSSSIHNIWKYLDEQLKIVYESGKSVFGPGKELFVYNLANKEEIVFQVEDEESFNTHAKGPHIIVDDFYVTRYIPGDWQKRVNRLFEDVSSVECRAYKKDFPDMNIPEDK